MLYAFFWGVPPRLNFIRQRFGTLCLFHLHRRVGTYPPMKMEQTECSETLAYKIQTPRNYPEESIQLEERCWRSVMCTNTRSAINQSAENMLGDSCDEIFSYNSSRHSEGLLDMVPVTPC